ncbi:unnamed protein product [Caenorhabditis angaria]|uniref:Uncharacterized protein n=1 Tax=Caenorhabditis angaria TaxID=860376 RepID=A0A9P1IRW4_9PELO|nr:unnamed protein product [Caenorhabditis angaria]
MFTPTIRVVTIGDQDSSTFAVPTPAIGCCAPPIVHILQKRRSMRSLSCGVMVVVRCVVLMTMAIVSSF